MAKGAAPTALERFIGRHLRHSRARYRTRKDCQNSSGTDNNRFFNKLLVRSIEIFWDSESRTL